MVRTYERNQSVEAAPLNEEAILLDPTTSKFFMLNRTSAFIWERLSRPTTAESLAKALSENFDNVPADALSDVVATLDDMLSMGLVVRSDAP
jgi:coenzyme PQQ synthesis protein D (PqqD)